MTTQPALDENKLMEFLGAMVGDMGAAMSALMVNIGDQLGLYKAMDGAGPLTSEELGGTTGTHERYVREWLSNQAASGYVAYDPITRRFTLPRRSRRWPSPTRTVLPASWAAFNPGVRLS